MDCQRPIKNEKTNKWEVWDFAYEENGERFYEVHEHWTFDEAIEDWKYLVADYENAKKKK
jgi:hypothetical protein